MTLRAPGLGGTDSIFMGIQSYGDTALDYYNVRLMGGTAFNPGAIPPSGDYWTAFANYSPRVQALLWNQPMPYCGVIRPTKASVGRIRRSRRADNRSAAIRRTGLDGARRERED